MLNALISYTTGNGGQYRKMVQINSVCKQGHTNGLNMLHDYICFIVAEDWATFIL